METKTGTRGEKVQESKTDVARRESTSKNSEIERYRSQIKQLEEILSQFGDAQTLISSLTGELQITSSTAEECDRSLLKLYSSLKTMQDQLREVRELIMAKENEREILVVKLTVAES
jgi:peptidoglycan hydrolase CwlO-like protein